MATAVPDSGFFPLTVLVTLRAARIYNAIVALTDGTATLQPMLQPYDTVGSGVGDRVRDRFRWLSPGSQFLSATVVK